MRKINWDNITENEGGEYPRPVPGAYIARIVNVEDDEDKEYLRIEWDFDEGEYKGYNADTYERAGFWPTVLYRSYKPKALPFFKAFKTALEMSNPRYTFREDRLQEMCGKLFGVVLGEEEYTGNDRTVKTRLYVAQTRSVKAIRDGDFKVPQRKTLQGAAAQSRSRAQALNAPVGWDEAGDDGELPF